MRGVDGSRRVPGDLAPVSLPTPARRLVDDAERGLSHVESQRFFQDAMHDLRITRSLPRPRNVGATREGPWGAGHAGIKCEVQQGTAGV